MNKNRAAIARPYKVPYNESGRRAEGPSETVKKHRFLTELPGIFLLQKPMNSFCSGRKILKGAP
ncbi:MAG: hypothetical protein ACOX88_04875 [Christensenellales bacterium]